MGNLGASREGETEQTRWLQAVGREKDKSSGGGIELLLSVNDAPYVTATSPIFRVGGAWDQGKSLRAPSPPP